MFYNHFLVIDVVASFCQGIFFFEVCEIAASCIATVTFQVTLKS